MPLHGGQRLTGHPLIGYKLEAAKRLDAPGRQLVGDLARAPLHHMF
jgi:hypothetical protein